MYNYDSFNFERLFEKHNSKDDTMNESEIQRVYNLPIHPRDSKIHSEKGFVNIDNGCMGVVIGVVL